MNRLLCSMVLMVLGALFVVTPVCANPDVMVGHVSGQATVVRVPIVLNNAEAARAVLSISYDPEYLTPVEQVDNPARFHLAGKAAAGEIITSTTTGASVQVALENPSGLLGNGELVVLPFTLNSNSAAGIVTPLAITATFSDAAGDPVTPGLLASGSVSTQDSTMVAVRYLLLSKPHLPTVSAGGTPTAYPASIVPGGTAVLTWGFLYADTVTIDNGIGTVASSGMIAVSPTVTTTYHITATSPAGTITLEVTVTVDQNNPLTIQITSPAAGASIQRPDTMVSGMITNSANTETGVTVNGVVALKENNSFTASHVPLKPGSNIITATVTDIDGHSTGTSIIVQADPGGNYIVLNPDTIMGLAPFELTLSVDATFTLPATGAALTHTGPGTVQILSSTPDTFTIRLTTPGIYFFTATVVNQGITYTDVVAVQVLDSVALDASLKAKWNAMKARLAVQDVTGAVTFYANGSKDVYQQQFTALSAVLPQIVQEMDDITFLDLQDNRVTYDLRTVRNNETYSFQVTFIRERDGIWRIWNY